jgi:hypothetical protein
MNNTAYVGRLGNIRKIEGADKIVQASVLVNGIVCVPSVVVGTDSVEGQTVVYFDSNLCLGPALLKDNPELEKYLAKNGRVKVVRLKGTISNGLVVDVEKFYGYAPASLLVEGYEFTDLKKVHICHKYIAPIKIQTIPGSGKNNKRNKQKVKNRLVDGQFNFHADTIILRKAIREINPNDVISISQKMHGTSSIASKVLVKRELSWFEKIVKWMGANIIEAKYDTLYASRTVIKNGTQGGFYSDDIWTSQGQKFASLLHDGETVYFEIVGYTPSGGFIQKSYDYGCYPGHCKSYVYRITKTGADGQVIEYGWEQMKARALELGLEHVKEYYFGKAKDRFPEITVDEDWHANFLDKLVEVYLEKDLEENLVLRANKKGKTEKIPDEGIVIKLERTYERAYKLKSERFFEFESANHESGEVDMEEDQPIADEIVEQSKDQIS